MATHFHFYITTGQKCLQNQAPRDQKHHLIVAAESDRKHLTGEEVLAEGQTKEGTRAEVTAEEMTPSKTTANEPTQESSTAEETDFCNYNIVIVYMDQTRRKCWNSGTTFRAEQGLGKQIWRAIESRREPERARGSRRELERAGAEEARESNREQ